MISKHKLDLIPDQLWLSFNKEKTVATLNFHIEKSRNAVSAEVAAVLSELSEAFLGNNNQHPVMDLIKEKKLLVLTLRSHCDGVFLAGGNLHELASMPHPNGELFTKQMRCFTQMLRSAPFVTVAILNGIAAGGGAEIALAADLRLSISKAVQIHFAQTYWGVPAGWGMMSDLTLKSVFGGERRRGIAMATQESLDLEALCLRQLIDARFENTDSPEDASLMWLDTFVARLLRCPEQLRNALIVERPQVQADKLTDFDKNLFEQFWLGPVHRGRIHEYREMRSKQKKDS
jgi:enoyl-CoA hydratase/carnithine racemase